MRVNSPVFEFLRSYAHMPYVLVSIWKNKTKAGRGPEIRNTKL